MKSKQSRRQVIKSAAGIGAAAVGLSPLPAAAAKSPMRLDDPEWNRDALARLQGNLDFGKVKHGWYSGVVCGVRYGEPVRPLMNFEGFSSI